MSAAPENKDPAYLSLLDGPARYARFRERYPDAQVIQLSNRSPVDRSDKKTYLEWLHTRIEQLKVFRVIVLGANDEFFDKIVDDLKTAISWAQHEKHNIDSLPPKVKIEKYGIEAITPLVLSQNKYCRRERELWEVAQEGVLLGVINDHRCDFGELKATDRPLTSFNVIQPAELLNHGDLKDFESVIKPTAGVRSWSMAQNSTEDVQYQHLEAKIKQLRSSALVFEMSPAEFPSVITSSQKGKKPLLNAEFYRPLQESDAAMAEAEYGLTVQEFNDINEQLALGAEKMQIAAKMMLSHPEFRSKYNEDEIQSVLFQLDPDSDPERSPKLTVRFIEKPITKHKPVDDMLRQDQQIYETRRGTGEGESEGDVVMEGTRLQQDSDARRAARFANSHLAKARSRMANTGILKAMTE